jgi:DNA-binding LacI/PurR family transcriptional regulator
LAVTETKLRVSRYIDKYLASVRPGESLPSYRKLMQGCRGSYDTVAGVVADMQNRGLIEVRDRSGIYKSTTASASRLRHVDILYFGKTQELRAGRFHGEFIHEIMQACSVEDLVPRYHILDRQANTFQLEPLLREEDIQACILVNVRTPAQLQAVAQSGVTFVNAFGLARPSQAESCSITIDDIELIDLQMEHLRTLGHRRIGYLHIDDPAVPSPSLARRIERFREVMAAPAMELDTSWIRYAGFNAEQTLAAIERVFTSPQRPTALIVYDYNLAWVYAGLQRLGLRVPQDVSIVGTDDLPIASMLYPAATSLRLDRAAVARHAISCLQFPPRANEPFITPMSIINRHSTLTLLQQPAGTNSPQALQQTPAGTVPATSRQGERS